MPAATRPRPTWGRFKGRRRISWPRAQRPAGCLGGARRGICWASQGARFPPSAGGGWRGLPRTPRPSVPTPPTSRQQPKPTPQAGLPALPAKGVGLASCPLLIPGIPKDDHRFPPEKALEPAKASRDELIRRWIGGGRDGAGQGGSVRCWDQLQVFWVRLLGYNQGVLYLSWKSIRCHLVPCWDLVVQSSGVGTLSGCSPLDVGSFTQFLDGVVGIHSGKVCDGSWSRDTWSRCGDCFSGFRVWVWCSSPGQVVGAFPGVSWKPI